MYRLTVTIHANPDRNEGDWVETHTVSASNMSALRKVISDFQRDNDIGGGNWGEAELRKDGLLIGYMSYNGRVWKEKYWELDSVGNEVIL
jgi:hypothetical protein